MTPRFVFLCFAATLCGCESFLYRFCLYGKPAPEGFSETNVAGSELESGNEPKASKNPHAIIVEPDPQIPRIMISKKLDSEDTGENVISYTLDDEEYPSLEALCEELENSRPTIAKTGIWYSTLNSCSRDTWVEASEFLEDYCLRNDIDLFRGIERDLYSGIPPGRFITWWTIRSSKTKYRLAEKRKRKPVQRVPEPMSELLLKEIPSNTD